jgi:hypothetical protein
MEAMAVMVVATLFAKPYAAVLGDNRVLPAAAEDISHMTPELR